MPADLVSGLTTGTISTGELWTEAISTPIDEPTTAPPVTSVMK